MVLFQYDLNKTMQSDIFTKFSDEIRLKILMKRRKILKCSMFQGASSGLTSSTPAPQPSSTGLFLMNNYFK